MTQTRPQTERADGLPPLPGADIRLHRARNLSRPAALLADHLQRAISE